MNFFTKIRPEWELFDKKKDPSERINVAYKSTYQRIFHDLKKDLQAWQNITSDPWICAPHSVLEGDVCMDLLI